LAMLLGNILSVFASRKKVGLINNKRKPSNKQQFLLQSLVKETIYKIQIVLVGLFVPRLGISSFIRRTDLATVHCCRRAQGTDLHILYYTD
jgi:hypothetical protein